MYTWPGADLVSARSLDRTLRRQRDALSALAAAAAAVGALVVSVAFDLDREAPRRVAAGRPAVPVPGKEQRAELGRRLRGIAHLLGMGM